MNVRIATTVALAALAVSTIVGVNSTDAATPASTQVIPRQSRFGAGNSTIVTDGTSNTLNLSVGASNPTAGSGRTVGYTFEDVLITP